MSYQAFDFVMVRSPILSIESYLALTLSSSAAGAEPLAPIDPRVRRALAIGSPSLLDALDRTPPDSAKAPQVRAKLRRFLIRMATRPTPFGMFAGVALAGWGVYTDLALDRPPRTRTRLDMEWIVHYVRGLEARPEIHKQLRWATNSTAWTHGGRVTVSGCESSSDNGSLITPSVPATPMVRRALGLARVPIAYRTLVDQLLAGDPLMTAEEVERLLQQLREQGFLRTELLPPVTAEDPIRWVRERLASINGGEAHVLQLDGLLDALAACDACPAEQAPDVQQQAAAHAVFLTQPQARMPLQVDTALGLGGTRIASAVADEAALAAELLLRLTPSPKGPAHIVGYRRAFIARYGAEREVPLLELLHPEWGLGPPIVGRHGSGEATVDLARARQRAETLQHLAIDAIRDGRPVIELDEELLRRLETHAPATARLPLSIDLNLFVLASSVATMDAGGFQLAVGPNVGAGAAGRNLARFADLLGPSARAALECAAGHEEAFQTDRIVAEIAYLPRRFRLANVVVRPKVRDYEVNVDVSAGVASDHVIPLDELVVGVREDRFYVRWLSRDVEVVFASGHMLTSLEATRECLFLSEIGRDGVAQINGFDWGAANGCAFLPRVQSGRIILHSARWRLDLFVGQGRVPVDDAKKFVDWFGRWRERWRVPRYVYLSAGDNRLLCDLELAEHVDDLQRELRRPRQGSQCLLEEALPGPEHAWLPARGGRHIVELVVSLGLRGAAADRATECATPERRWPSSLVAADVRLRPPGSDWLYLKLYGPRSGQDELLAGPLRDLCREVIRQQIAEEWFFLRYADPDPHLRIRFRGSPERLLKLLLPHLCTWSGSLVEHELCQKYAFDTYEREVERYGGADAVVASETLFAADSRAVLDLLNVTKDSDRVLLAVVTVDALLSALRLDEAARLHWLRQTVPSRKEVAEEYRAKREHLVAALRDPLSIGDIGSVLDARCLTVGQVAGRLAELDSTGTLTQPMSALYRSYVHMHCNRLCPDPDSERRALGLLLRSREAIAYQ